MKALSHLRSIQAQLTIVFALFLSLVIGVGCFGINRLSEVDRASNEIQSHWLRAAPLLGEINNLISDFRAAETGSLIAVGSHSGTSDFQALDRSIESARKAYEQVYRDDIEVRLYERFDRQWAIYRSLSAQVNEQASSGSPAVALALLNGDSRDAFNLASNTLNQLIEHNVVGAREATAHETDIYHRSRDLIVMVMLLSAAILVLAVGYIRQAITGPLHGLARRMHELAENDVHVQVDGAHRDDEIGAMARAVLVFRGNAIRLTESEARLREQANALRDALEAERKLTTQQQNFVSMTSHEFRTPLTIIDSHAQRLIRMKDRLRPDDLAERAGGIRAAVARMTRLIESLLGSSRLLEDGARLSLSAIDLAALVGEACETLRQVTGTAVIREHFGRDPVHFNGDSRLLFQAFSNLLANAIKFAPSGSPVDVHVTHAADSVQITIRDQGVGIPERDIPHLFERYFRGSNVSDVPGTGVGLYLVEMVVRMHGGQVTVDSVEGQGCSFTISLPRRAPPPQARTAKKAAPEAVIEQ